MQHAVHNRAIIRVADRMDVSGRATADEVNLDRFQNRIRKVCALVAARSKVYLSAAMMILIVTLAVPAAAQKLVPFNGAIQGQETDTLGSPPTQFAHGDTTGIATLVGQLRFTYDLTINHSNGVGTGSGHLIAANGDNIYTTVAAQFSPTPTTPGVGSITDINTIIGGTGRFAGAQGSFTVERLVDFLGENPHFTSGSFHGTILPRVQLTENSLHSRVEVTASNVTARPPR